MPHARRSRVRSSAEVWALRVDVRLEKNGPNVTREPVTPQDLADARGETWLECVLRRGHPEVPLDEVETRVRPVPLPGSEICLGYVLEITGADGPAGRREFTMLSLQHVAARAARRLVEEGRREQGQPYYYELRADRDGARPPRSPSGVTGIRLRPRREPLRIRTARFRPLALSGRRHGPADDGRSLPVVFTEHALSLAERVSRRGLRPDRPVETGGVLLGELCSCPDSGELFLVVRDVLEARDTEAGKFSLTYSGKTWSRIQAVVRARQASEPDASLRVVGQCHGHNFLPSEGEPPCEECPKRETCHRTSAFLSPDDAAWTRAVFAGQPWHVSQIFGLDARGRSTKSLFALRDGRYRERGFLVIPEFP